MGTFIHLVLISKASVLHYVMTMSSLAALLGVISKLSCVQKSLLKDWLDQEERLVKCKKWVRWTLRALTSLPFAKHLYLWDFWWDFHYGEQTSQTLIRSCPNPFGQIYSGNYVVGACLLATIGQALQLLSLINFITVCQSYKWIWTSGYGSIYLKLCHYLVGCGH